MALILVLDDEQDACTMLHRILSAMGHEVITFMDVDNTLSWLQGNVPDLVISDYRLHTLDGIQLLRLIRKHDPEIKVVMLTAYASAETASETLKLGALKYLVKPIEIEQLEANVEEVLSSIA
jgi:DNA-binding NtrC family response regulator